MEQFNLFLIMINIANLSNLPHVKDKSVKGKYLVQFNNIVRPLPYLQKLGL